MSDNLTIGNITFEEPQYNIMRSMEIIKEPIDNINLSLIRSCKYLLPCGKCDKTDQMCSQYEEVVVKG